MPLRLQEVEGVFRLAHPGCAGNETRLVDCPAVIEGDLETLIFEGMCDPSLDSYAFVACGNGTAATGVFCAMVMHTVHHCCR